MVSRFTVCLRLCIYSSCCLCLKPSCIWGTKIINILQLPARSTLQAYTGAFLHAPGANSASIEDQVAQFILYCHWEGKKESIKDGVLIYDKVKVFSCLMWNLRDHKLIGLGMNTGDQYHLPIFIDCWMEAMLNEHRIFSNFFGDQWLIGSYFIYYEKQVCNFLCYETIKLFYLHGLNTSLIVCDRALTKHCCDQGNTWPFWCLLNWNGM